MLEELQKVTDKQKQTRHGKIVNGLSGGNLEEKLDYSVDLRNLTAKWEDVGWIFFKPIKYSFTFREGLRMNIRQQK